MSIDGPAHQKQGGKSWCEVMALGMLAGFVGLVAAVVWVVF